MADALQKAHGIDEAVARATRALAFVGLIGLLILAIATIADVLMRWLLGQPIDGLSDIGELVIIFMVAACFPASIAGRHHITIRFLGKAAGWRENEALDAFGHLVALLVFAAIGWQLVLHTVDLYESGQTTWLLGIAMWPSWAVATALMVLAVPVQAMVLITHVRRACARTRPPGLAQHGIEVIENLSRDYDATREEA